MATVPQFTQEAEHLLRAPGLLHWSTVTLLALVVYVYAVEVERRQLERDARRRGVLADGLGE